MATNRTPPVENVSQDMTREPHQRDQQNRLHLNFVTRPSALVMGALDAAA